MVARLQSFIQQEIKGIPKPIDGKVDPSYLQGLEARLQAFIQQQIQQLPKPRDGKDGEPGKVDPSLLQTLEARLQAFIQQQIQQILNLKMVKMVNLEK